LLLAALPKTWLELADRSEHPEEIGRGDAIPPLEQLRTRPF
jgi:hypothetical protein